MSNYEIKLPASYMSPTAPQIRRTKHLQEHWGALPEEPKMTLEEAENFDSQVTEEVKEIREAIDEYKRGEITLEQLSVKMRDVCVDIAAFSEQFQVRTGIDKHVDRDSYEIYKNNLTKVCWSEEHADDTCYYYYDDKGIECDYRQVKDHWVVYRVSDGKIMKPLGFKGVEL